jgi:sulfofructose kinase
MPAQDPPRVAGLGIATLDYLFVSPRAFPGGQTHLRTYAIEGGGLVGTALVAAARLGARTEIRTWIGKDAAGEAVVAGLRAEGVDTARVAVVPGEPTSVAFIHVEESTGERTIYFAGCPQPSPAQQAELAEGPLYCDAVVVDAVWPEASATFARRARAAGIPVVGDFSPEGDHRPLASLMTALIVPRAGAEHLAPGASWEDRLRLLADTGAEFVAITAGAEGCYFFDDGKLCHQPAFTAPIVDTTGAGDVFHGAFAYARARRWPVARGMEFASAVAALSCRALGGRKAIPSYPEAAEFLRDNGSGRWEW